MAKDYVVNITGKDNLSATLKGVRQELNDTTSTVNGLDRIELKFERIKNSTAPLKRKLKELLGMMAKMNLDGLDNTDVFTRMAAEAASYKDAIGDAGAAVRLLSSDTATLDAGISAFLGLAGAASIATGVMGLLGNENEDVAKAILKVQSAVGVLNGVQSLANTLNKDSILMLKLKQFWEAANAKATVASTTATTANTVVTNANRIATLAWNTVKAVSKALLGDFTGLILVGAGALATYAIATSDSTDAEKEHLDSLDKSALAVDNYTSTLKSTFSQLMTQYSSLKAEWKSLSNEHQKNQWITDNKNKLKDLGISVDGVNSVESAFNKNTDAMVKAFTARAKAAAYLSKITDEYKKQIELIDQINTHLALAAAEAAKRPKVAAGLEIPEGTYRTSRYGEVNSAGKWVFSAKGAEIYNTGKTDGNQYINGLESQLKASQNRVSTYTNQMASELAKVPYVSSGSKGGKTGKTGKTGKGGKTTTTAKPEPVFKEDAVSIEDMTNNVNILTAKLKKLDPNTTEFEEVSKQIDSWKDKLAAVDSKLKKVEEKKPTFELGSIADLQSQIAAINEQLQNQNLTMDVRLNLLTDKEKLDNQVKELTDPLKIKEEAELAAAEAEKKRAEEQEQRRNKQIEGYLAIGDAASAMGLLMSAAGADGAAAAMQLVATTANATALMIPLILALIGAKEGEAMASGTASAAALPFPANIAAIASIIATVVGTFASIFSTVGAFADGGIILGASTHGDLLLARVNAGEMILNGSQLAKLFNMLDGAGAVGGAGMGLVTWKLRGSDLYGSLSNYSKIKAKSGKITGIK